MWSKRKAINEAGNAVSSYEQQARQLEAESAGVDRDLQQYQEEYIQYTAELTTSLLGKTINEDRFTKLSDVWECPQLMQTYAGLEGQRRDAIAKRDELLSNPIVANRINLVEGERASLRQEYEVKWQEKTEKDEIKKSYESEAFTWLYNNKTHLPKDDSGFKKMWKLLTLQSRKEKKYLEEVQDHFSRPFKSVVVDYEYAIQAANEKQTLFHEVKQRYDQAVELLSYFDQLCQWDSNFTQLALQELHNTLNPHIAQTPPNILITRVPESLRSLAGAMFALTKKMEYSQQLKEYLHTEIADRNQRISSISYVRSKWRRNPSGFVRGDKSKWLQDIPAMKLQGTQKRVGWSQNMRSNLSSYSDYSTFSKCMFGACAVGGGFLAYDLFNRKPSIRMPYEGFSSGVIREIRPFRHRHYDSSDWIEDSMETADMTESEVDWESDLWEESEENWSEEESSLEEENTLEEAAASEENTLSAEEALAASMNDDATEEPHDPDFTMEEETLNELDTESDDLS